MGPAPFRPHALRGRVFRGREAIDAGLLSPEQLRSRAWRRLFHGVYADSRLTITHATRCAAATEFVLPAGSVLAATGRGRRDHRPAARARRGVASGAGGVPTERRTEKPTPKGMRRYERVL